MSTKRRVLLPTITGIVPSSAIGTVGTLDIPIGSGFRLHDLQIVYIDGGGSPTDVTAMFSDIGIYRNGTPQRTFASASDLDHMNSLNGSQYARQQVNTGANMRQTLPVFMAEPWRKDKVDTDVLAWNVCAENGWKTLQVKLKLATAMPSTGSLVCYAWIEDVPTALRGVAQSIKKVYTQQIPASGLSIDVTTLDQKDALQVISLKHPTTGVITKVSLKRNSDLIMDQVVREDNYAALIGKGMVPANSTTASAFGYDIVLDADDPNNSALYAQGQSLWLQVAFSVAAAGNVIAVIERIGPLD